jgi:Flp pilus assembly protein TadD
VIAVLRLITPEIALLLLRNAIAVKLEAITLAPTYALAHTNLGRAYDKADRPQDALNSLDQALQLNPNLQWAVELRDKIRQRLKS